MTRIKIVPMILIAVLVFASVRRSLSAHQGDQDQRVGNEGAIVTSFEEMSYPHLARLANIEGVVVVRVILDDDGKVVSASAITGHDLLVRQALPNASKWRFLPNSSKAAVIIYEFRFADGTCGDTRSQLFVFREPNVASVIACPESWQATALHANMINLVSPMSLKFGNQPVGTPSAAKIVTLTNNLGKGMTIGPMTISGTNAGDFAFTTTCETTLAANAQCTASITFKPTATGTRTATLNVNDSAAHSPQTVALTGTGTGN